MLMLTKIFGSELYDASGFEDLIFRFAINIVFAFLVIRAIYYPVQKRKDYLFTYFLFNIVIFFVCLMLGGVKLKMGFALGLFAIFGLLRYRTEAVAIKEMTYLFIVIALGLINSLFNEDKTSLAELLFTNTGILAATYLLEKVWLVKQESFKNITYERIELIKPERREELIADLRERTGLDIHSVTIGRIDFLSDTANIRIFYFERKEEKENPKP